MYREALIEHSCKFTRTFAYTVYREIKTNVSLINSMRHRNIRRTGFVRIYVQFKTGVNQLEFIKNFPKFSLLYHFYLVRRV